MKKIIFIVLSISIFVFSCSNQNADSSKEPATLDIDFQIIFGENVKDDNILSENSYLRVSGTYGDIDAKVDATTSASTPEGATKSWNSYRYKDGQYAFNKMERSLGFFVLYGVSSARIFNYDGMAGNDAMKTLNDVNGPKITGTGISKDDSGIITIRYAHAGGESINPYVYELKSDTNGIFKIGYDTDNFKMSSTPISNDIDFNDIPLITDKAREGISYWQGDLQSTLENDILTLKGTLKEVK